MKRVLVLGTTGMLGSMVFDWLGRDASLELHGTVRQGDDAWRTGFGTTDTLLRLDAEGGETPDLSAVDWVVNCIGVIKPYIRDDQRDEVWRAIQVNSLFPMRLAAEAERTGARVIQIATDCVYSGRGGSYDERSSHDATDAYGKTKSLGEVVSPQVWHLRCSIIGPQRKGRDSLLNWFLKQERGASLNGFRNHQWNGVTTLHFARLCGAMINGGLEFARALHVVPTGDISKANLLRCFATEYQRKDLEINDVDAGTVIDRRLGTIHAEANRQLWSAAGYDVPPSVEQMVHEMSIHRLRQ